MKKIVYIVMSVALILTSVIQASKHIKYIRKGFPNNLTKYMQHGLENTIYAIPTIKYNKFLTINKDPSAVQPNINSKSNVQKTPKIKSYEKTTNGIQEKRNFSTGISPFNKKSTGFTKGFFRSYSTKPPIDPHAGKALFDMLKSTTDKKERKKLHHALARIYFEQGTHPNEQRMKELNTAIDDLSSGRSSTWSESTGSSHSNSYDGPKTHTYHEPKTYSSSKNEPIILSKDARNVLTECLEASKNSSYVDITTNDGFTITVNINYLEELMTQSVLERRFFFITPYKSQLQQNINDLLTNSQTNSSYDDLKNKIFPFISNFLSTRYPDRKINPDDLKDFLREYRLILRQGSYSGKGLFYDRFNVRIKKFNPIAELYFLLTAEAILVSPGSRKFPITIAEFEKFLQSLYMASKSSELYRHDHFMTFNENFDAFAYYIKKRNPSWWKIW